MDWRELQYALNRYKAHGSKLSRRRTIARSEDLLEHARARGITHPDGLSRRVVYDWIDETNSEQRYYAARRVWIALGRAPLPKPRSLEAASL